MIFSFFKKKKTVDDPDKPKKRVIINVEQQEKRIAFMVGQKLENFFIERDSDEPVAGNIYKGIVKNVLPSIQAAFIDIGVNKNGFIHVSDIKENFSMLEQLISDEDIPAAKKRKTTPKVIIQDILKENQEILVQVRKEAIGQKGVRLSNYISLPGRNLVMIPDTNLRGISRKITDRKERVRLKEVLSELTIPDNYGIIVRTAAGKVLKKSFEKDINYLLNTWETIQSESQKKTAPSCIHIESDISIKTIRDIYTPEIEEIIVDSKEDYYKIKKYFHHFFPQSQTKISYYKLKTPIFDYYSVEDEISKIFHRKIWLKCGGYIIIDETEALVAIDVNTGRNISHNNLEDTVKNTNLEAAEEIARQVRLRNMGGIIVIDFIDMARRDNRKAVLERLSQALSKDRAKTNILPISEIGLIEMTRQRMKESLNQELYEKCEHCKGRGVQKSLLSVSIETIRKIKRLLFKAKDKKINIFLNPQTLEKILGDNPNFKRDMERKFRKRININTDNSLNREMVKAEYVYSQSVEII